MAQITRLKKSEREDILALNPGILTEVAGRLNVSLSKVSRTFHGHTKRKDPRVVAALEMAIERSQSASQPAA